MDRNEIIELAHHAGIVFRLGGTDVTPEKLDAFLELVKERKTRRWEAKKVTDVSRGAREVKIDYRDPDIRVSSTVAEKTRGFWIFWLRPEGGVHKPGLNLTKLPNGFVLTLYTQRFKYRFRFRRGIKPNFLWGKEP